MFVCPVLPSHIHKLSLFHYFWLSLTDKNSGQAHTKTKEAYRYNIKSRTCQSIIAASIAYVFFLFYLFIILQKWETCETRLADQAQRLDVLRARLKQLIPDQQEEMEEERLLVKVH